MNRREFLQTLGTICIGTVVPSVSQNLASTLYQPPQPPESKETNNEKIAKITAQVFFDFCQEKIDKDKQFNLQDGKRVKSSLQDYFTEHPFCKVEEGKLTLCIDKAYTDKMAEVLMKEFKNRLSGRVQNAITLLGQKNARKAIAYCLKEDPRFIPNLDAEKVIIRDIGASIANLNKHIVETENVASLTIGTSVQIKNFEQKKIRAFSSYFL